jgi:hypothetical protein
MRPLGCTLIAVWLWVRSAIGLLFGLGLLFAGGLAGKLASLAHAGTTIPSFLTGLGVFLGVAVAGISLLTAAAGLGIWLMKGWGRVLTLALAGLSLLLSIRVLFHPHFLNLIKPVVDVAMIGYLMIPDVQSKFS